MNTPSNRTHDNGKNVPLFSSMSNGSRFRDQAAGACADDMATYRSVTSAEAINNKVRRTLAKGQPVQDKGDASRHATMMSLRCTSAPQIQFDGDVTDLPVQRGDS